MPAVVTRVRRRQPVSCRWPPITTLTQGGRIVVIGPDGQIGAGSVTDRIVHTARLPVAIAPAATSWIRAVSRVSPRDTAGPPTNGTYSGRCGTDP